MTIYVLLMLCGFACFLVRLLAGYSNNPFAARVDWVAAGLAFMAMALALAGGLLD